MPVKVALSNAVGSGGITEHSVPCEIVAFRPRVRSFRGAFDFSPFPFWPSDLILNIGYSGQNLKEVAFTRLVSSLEDFCMPIFAEGQEGKGWVWSQGILQWTERKRYRNTRLVFLQTHFRKGVYESPMTSHVPMSVVQLDRLLNLGFKKSRSEWGARASSSAYIAPAGKPHQREERGLTYMISKVDGGNRRKEENCICSWLYLLIYIVKRICRRCAWIRHMREILGAGRISKYRGVARMGPPDEVALPPRRRDLVIMWET